MAGVRRSPPEQPQGTPTPTGHSYYMFFQDLNYQDLSSVVRVALAYLPCLPTAGSFMQIIPCIFFVRCEMREEEAL
jgi:hypothetical protein